MSGFQFFKACWKKCVRYGQCSWLFVLLPLFGCSDTAYYWQAGVGQFELWWKRRSITDTLEYLKVPPTTKTKLKLVQAIQQFGTERLEFSPKGHYRYYVDLERPQVSWLVVAAPPFQMEAHPFCYLVVGCMGYKGFFERDKADALAEQLQKEGMDVLVRPVPAYSTLGWFDDPILSSVLNYDSLSLMDTVLHEQAHVHHYVKGETTFNESFASFMAWEGVRQYIQQSQHFTEQDWLKFQQRQRDQALFRQLVLSAREALVKLYNTDATDAVKKEQKAQLLSELTQQYQRVRAQFKVTNYDQWFKQPLNNAHLVGIAQYVQWVPAFQALYQQQEKSFPRFYEAVKSLSALSSVERIKKLSTLTKQALVQSQK